MQGLEDLVARRLDGEVPALVQIDMGTMYLHELQHLVVGRHEPIHSLDLRAVHGLVVSVSGTEAARVKAIAEACKEAGARRVIANTHQELPEGRFEVIEVTDTEGHFTWRKQ